MSVILYIYYYFNIAFGVFNVFFNSVTNKFQLYHWPTIIYCGLFQLFTIIWQIYTIIFYFEVDVPQALVTPSQIISVIFQISANLTFIICELKVWLERHRYYKVIKQLKILYDNFLLNDKMKYINNIRYQLLIKCIATSLQIIIFLLDIIDRTDLGVQCKVMTCDTKYMIGTSFYSFRDLYFILVDMNIYIGFVFIYICCQMLMNRLQNIENIVEIEDILRTTNEREWRLKLNHDSFEIIRLLCQLKYLLNEFFIIFQYQILMLLMTTFFNLVLVMLFVIYNLVDISQNDSYDYSIITSTLYQLLIITMSMSNVLLMFNIWEILLNSFKEMTHKVYDIIIKDLQITGDILFKKDDFNRNVCYSLLLLF